MRRLYREKFARVMLSTALLVLGGTAFAFPPPRPGLVDPYTMRYRTTGHPVPVIPEAVRSYRRPTPLNGKYPFAQRKVASRKATVRPLAVDTQTETAIRPLVLLVDFVDAPVSGSPAIANPTAFSDLFFGAGPSDLSVSNYWAEVSYRTFAIQPPSSVVPPGNPNVVGWLLAGGTAPTGFPSTVTSISGIAGVNVPDVRQLLADAIASLSSQGFDFSPYVRFSDRTFNAVIIVHPAYGQEDSGNAGDPYSHTASIAPIDVTIGGQVYSIVDYTLVPARQYYNDPTPDTDPSDDRRIGIGVIVHEMGHLLGLPDLYPTSSIEGQVGGDFTGVGVFDLMGYGLWGNNFLTRADNPAHLSAWLKSFLGWLTPANVLATSTRKLRPVEQFPDADKVFSNTSQDPGQYFLVENRQLDNPVGGWLFDKSLVRDTGGGRGILIWQVNDNVIQANLSANTVNVDSANRGLWLKEADGILHTGLPITGVTANDRAVFFGIGADFFVGGDVFDRTSPSATVNSSPVIDNVYHPDDFGSQVAMVGFSTDPADGSVTYAVGISAGGGVGSLWKTFNVANTTGTYPVPMRSNDILSLSFDSGNNTWMGSRDQGIFRFLGTNFDILTPSQGLPRPGAGAPAGATTAPIQAMAFEAATGSMWVGTDQGLFKMRDSGSGFRVQSSFTRATPLPATLTPPLDNVRGIVVQKGTDAKYLATSGGLVLVTDGLGDGSADDRAGLVGPVFNAAAVALDDNGDSDPKNDILWVGSSNGTLFRTDGQLPVLPIDAFPLPLKSYTLIGNPAITSLAVDKQGILWIGTDRGVQAFDLGDNLTPPKPNLRDPYDFDGDGNTQFEAYLDFHTTTDVDGVNGSNNVTGVGFEASDLPLPVTWFSQRNDVNFPSTGNFAGGASRFDANRPNDNTTPSQDERLKVYSPVPPPGVPAAIDNSTSVSAVAGDTAGNVWLATTQPQANGVVRFGNAGVISLDRDNYVNTTAVAQVTLQDDGLNASPGAAETALVRITSASDPKGFPLFLSETGQNTGVFSGTFGFTNGPTDPAAQLISVKSGDVVTARYVDFTPPGVRTATATWKTVFPFEDGLIIKPLCFISTAAFGSAMAPEVVAFRAFRDRYLAGNAVGRALVEFYYIASPPLAGWIARSPFLRATTRFLLVPAARLSAFATGALPEEKAVVVLIFGLGAVLCLVPGRGTRSRYRN